MSNYPRANTTAQHFAGRYPGAKMTPNVVVLHTTETTGWPGYENGATAPNYTGRANCKAKRLDWRAHFPDEMSARALVNSAGGVETNTLNAEQVELIGTCDPRHRRSWDGKGKLRAGRDYIYWPDAPDWALDDLAAFLADQHQRHGIRLEAPALWLPYPASYGKTTARLSFDQWRHFYGICGHQHVPENVHGDPGNLPIGRVLAQANALVDPPPAKPRKHPNADAIAKHAARGVAATKGKRRAVFAKIRDLAKTITTKKEKS